MGLVPADNQYTLHLVVLAPHHSLYLLRYSQRMAGFGEWSRRVRARRVVPSPSSSPSSPPSYASTGGLSRAVRNRSCGAVMFTSSVAAVLHLGDLRSAVPAVRCSVLARALALLLLPVISTSSSWVMTSRLSQHCPSVCRHAARYVQWAQVGAAAILWQIPQLCRVRFPPRDRLLCSSSQAGQLLAVGADALRFRPRPPRSFSEAASCAAASSCTSMLKQGASARPWARRGAARATQSSYRRVVRAGVTPTCVIF